ncbi:FAD-binding oxidoreductase [Caballeronia sp. J97]|uniref:NAD(P)/FAD-dependent oxidoreductase n=1 Tax=Caballeronia sp. J97 TaxID=2805429 RepID=UPI002AB257D4|nr:FAD-binding oxidoreductase [Caballeronia sp. J97]
MPADGPFGIRHIGGVTLTQASVRNLGTCRPDAKGEFQVVLTDRKVFITPMDTGLRIAGTVEFGGLAREPNHRRAALLARHGKEGLPTLNLLRGSTTWMGHRPCMPDSMPVLGAVPRYAGLWLAFEHGRLGLTSSATTGRLLAEAICQRESPSVLAPFSTMRFDSSKD